MEKIKSYGKKPLFKRILKSRKGYIKMYVPFSKTWDNHEEEQ